MAIWPLRRMVTRQAGRKSDACRRRRNGGDGWRRSSSPPCGGSSWRTTMVFFRNIQFVARKISATSVMLQNFLPCHHVKMKAKKSATSPQLQSFCNNTFVAKKSEDGKINSTTRPILQKNPATQPMLQKNYP